MPTTNSSLVFYDRTKELDKLRIKYENAVNNAELIYLWGRRRIGKTALITEFLKQHQKNSVYTFIVEGGKKQILHQISNDITEAGDFFATEDWDTLFRYLNKKSKNSPFIFVIDEFQRLYTKHKHVISRFQKEWDNVLKYNNLVLILAGSSIGMMRRVGLEDSAPLVGRPTWKFQLKPFSYIDFREMFKDFTEEDKIRIYSVFGGTPDYLSRLRKYVKPSEKFDIFTHITNLTLDSDGELFNEPETLLKSELRRSEKYLEIVEAIAYGSGKVNKETIHMRMVSKSKKFNYNSLGYYLQNLEKFLDLIKLEQPLFFESKMGRYSLADNFFKFYFKFVYPNKKTIDANNIEFVLNNIKKQLDNHIGQCYEEIIKDILIFKNRSKLGELELNFIKIGSWWNRQREEIDICAEGEHTVLLGEVKWNKKPIDKRWAENLLRKSSYVKTNKEKKFVMFSRNGFDDECMAYMNEHNIFFFTLKDLSNILESTPSESWRQTFKLHTLKR